MFKRIAIIVTLILTITLTGCLQQKETQPTYTYYDLPVSHIRISSPYEFINKDQIEKLHLYYNLLIIHLKDNTIRIVEQGNYQYV